MFQSKLCFALCGLLLSGSLAADPLDSFKGGAEWATAANASGVGKGIQISADADKEKTIIYNGKNFSKSDFLTHKAYLSDAIINADFLVAKDSTAILFLQGRFALPLTNKNNEWQHLSIKFRAARFDEGKNKLQDALLLEMRVNGDIAMINNIAQKNIILNKLSEGAPVNWEDEYGQLKILATQGQFALRNVDIRPADFAAITLPQESGKATNEKDLVDYVALGKETFESFGCNVCHTISTDSNTASAGPNLYGLFMQTPRNREIVEGENHHFTIKADNTYLHRSVRSPTEQLAVGEKGAKKGEVYPPIMPPFSAQVLSDIQVDAVGAYLATQNEPQNQGPAIKLMKQTGQQAYDPLNDGLQMLVDTKTRIQRGPMEGVSGRAIHVGQTNSINYTFDPRLLAIVKIWQGGFLDMSGEWLNRGGKGLKTGYESREINLGKVQVLLAPLNAKGIAVDFSFKDAKFGDPQTARQSLYSTQDHLDRLAQEDAQFLGYDINSQNAQATPLFRYRIGKNTIGLQTTIGDAGDTRIEFTGTLKTAQVFTLNDDALAQVSVTQGTIENHQWRLPAGTKAASLTANMTLASNPWHAPTSAFDNRVQPVKIIASKANMPAGYSIESYYPPKDNFGREQLFEALGIAVAKDGTIVVATRTAGIWRIVKGEWKLFAEGTFDSLGVQIEDDKGLQIVVGQKAELTRIKDTNGDGIADSYQTLFDAHSYHGNYHAYMHGPVRGGDGAYYININLADGNDGSTYKANGAYMGSTGGFSGWTFRVKPNGHYEPWAYGLRSPAGLGVSRDGRVWYSENQGEYVGTSKIFVLKKGGFYGHPASLVDLPGMTPDSPEIAWDKVADKREWPVILIPYGIVANSPGSLVWDTTKGKFGAFRNQMFIGDQTQSNLMRVTTETVNGKEQGALYPFISGLESGVMRPVFLPDGSLLIGQTGRGWQAKGGHVASMQRIVWDGKTIEPALQSMSATHNGFTLQLTAPLNADINAEKLNSLITLDSWVYRDAADYGSDELGKAMERITNISISKDRKQITISLAELEHPSVHPQQTARIYHVLLNNQQLFSEAAPMQMHAYYTLYKFAK